MSHLREKPLENECLREFAKTDKEKKMAQKLVQIDHTTTFNFDVLRLTELSNECKKKIYKEQVLAW